MTNIVTIFRFLKPYRWRFALAMLFVAICSVSVLAFPYFLKLLIDSVQTGIHQAGTTGLEVLLGQVLAVLGILTIFSFLRVYFFTVVGENVLADIRVAIYSRVICMPMGFFEQQRVGELSSRIGTDLGQIREAVTGLLPDLLRNVFMLVVGISLIFSISLRLSLTMLAVLPVLVLINMLFSKRIRKVSGLAQDKVAEANVIVEETFQGAANVKAFANEWYEVARYGRALRDSVKMGIRNGRDRGSFVAAMQLSLFGGIMMLVYYGIILCRSGALSFGGLTAFVVYTAFLGGSLGSFAELYSQLQRTLGATQRVRELLLQVPEDVSIERGVADARWRLLGGVRFEDIFFHYPGRPEVPVLRGVSLDIEPGQKVALVGPSGAGKTTIAALLLRFHDPVKGRIFFDGLPGKNIPLSQLRDQMALVSQDVLLFGGSIRENIAYGKPGATQSEIEHAARQAYAHEFISRFPEGYDTIVGDRGIKLSGGQRQRIAIARAILKDPVILILDEATSSLDTASESIVREALDNLMKDRTSLIIAHRLSTIRDADKIIVMEKGTVRESGTHLQLLEMEDGLYRSLDKANGNYNQ